MHKVLAPVLMTILAVGGIGFAQPGSSPREPIYMLLVPSTEPAAAEEVGTAIAEAIYDFTGLYVVASLLADHTAMIEAFAASEGDAFGLLTADQYIRIYKRTGGNVSPRLGSVRYGYPWYYSSIYARRDSGIVALDDLNGKVWIYNDTGSMSGYVLPDMLFERNGIELEAVVATGGHTNSMVALVEGQGDFCTGYGSAPGAPEGWSGARWDFGDDPEMWIWDRRNNDLFPEESRGTCNDLRRAVQGIYDLDTILREIGVVMNIGPVPNDCVAFGPGFDVEAADVIVWAIKQHISTEEGAALWGDENFYGWTAVADINDSFYDGYRALLGLTTSDDTQEIALEMEQQIVEVMATYYMNNPPVPEMDGFSIAAAPMPLQAIPDCEECPVLAWVTELWPTGFIVTSWDVRVEPMIAFSTESEFPWEDDPENALRDVIIADMLNRISAHDRGVARGEDANLQKWRSILLDTADLDPFDVVGVSRNPLAYASHVMLPGPTSEYEGPEPLIREADQWSQQACYNEYCPCSQGCPEDCAQVTDRYKPGCVARAMAQVLYFHRYLDTDSMGRIVGEYTLGRGPTGPDKKCTLYKEDLELGDPSLWNLSNAASRLCFAAAASLSARFEQLATGADFEDAADVLCDVWGFLPTSLFEPGYVDSACFDRLEADVLCRRPCLLELRGYNVASHAVTCDGYKREHMKEDGTVFKLTSYYHLQMGRSTGGTTAWYNLTNPTNYPAGYCATVQAVLDIAPPTATVCAGDCSVDLRADRENGRYAQAEAPVITAQSGRPAAAVLYDFNPLLFDLLSFLTSVTFGTSHTIGREPTQLSLFPIRIQGLGIQTLILVADMGACTAIDACRYAVGVDASLLDDAQVSVIGQAGSRLIDYRITCDCDVNRVWIYLVTPERGPVHIPCDQKAQGTVSVSHHADAVPGECLVLLIANTTKGVLAGTCRY